MRSWFGVPLLAALLVQPGGELVRAGGDTKDGPGTLKGSEAGPDRLIRREREKAVAAIRRSGGTVSMEKDPALGEEAVEVRFSPRGASDILLLQKLPKLQRLTLEGPHVNDGLMKQVGTLAGLRRLTVLQADITGTGLAHLRGLIKLRELRLDQCHRVTDEGVRHLCGLARLEALSLKETLITKAGLDSLKRMPNLRSLTYRPALELEKVKPVSEKTELMIVVRVTEIEEE